MTSNVGANAFLNSPNKISTLGPNPNTERGYPSIINAHPKEPRVIYACGKFIVVRNIENPNDCFIYRGHTYKTTVAKFSPNGYWVASADVSGKVKVWSWDNPEHLTKLDISVISGPISDLDWDSESKKIAAVGEGGSGILAKVFTWDTGNSAGELVGHTKRVSTVSFKPTRPFRLITGGEDMQVVFFSGPPFKFTSNHSSHTNFVNTVRFSPDGSVIASVGSDKKIQIYDSTSGEPTREVLNAHDGTIFAGCFSPDSTKFVTASGDRTLKVWDVASLTAITTIHLSSDPQISDMQQSVVWVGNNIVSLSLNGNLNVFSAADFAAPPRVIQAHQTAITSLAIDRATSTIFTGSNDGVVIARNLSTGVTQKVVGTDKKIISGGAHNGKVVGLALSNGELVSVGFDDAARYASLTTLSYHSDLPLNGQPIALAYSSSLAAVVTNNEIAVLRGATKIASLANFGFNATSIAIVGDSEVAVGGDDSKVHIFSIEGSTLTAKTQIQGRSAISSLAYSPDQNFLAVGDSGRLIEVYERSTWAAKIGGKWCFHTSKVNTLSWSPSGAFLASGSTDENIFVWNFSKPLSKLNFPYAHQGGVTGLDWLNESTLVSVGGDHVVVTWKIPETI